MSDVGLDGQVVFITGASRGIGAATSRQFARLGATVIRISRSPMAPLDRAVTITADLADRRSRDAALAEATRRCGTPNIVVSNAGAFLLAPLSDTSDDLLAEQIGINLEAPFAIARHFVPLMAARGSGVHVIVGSVADWRPFAGNAAYAASKYAVRGFHEVMLEECRGTGVRCTLVSPGPTDTSVWDPIDPDHRDDLPNRTSMLRPHDVAEAIVFAATRPPHVQMELIRLGPA